MIRVYTIVRKKSKITSPKKHHRMVNVKKVDYTSYVLYQWIPACKTHIICIHLYHVISLKPEPTGLL